MEHFDSRKISLYRSVLAFNKQHRRDYYELLDNAGNVKVFVFKNHRQANAFLAKL